TSLCVSQAQDNKQHTKAYLLVANIDNESFPSVITVWASGNCTLGTENDFEPIFLAYPGVNAYAWGFYHQVAFVNGTTDPCTTVFGILTSTDPAVGSWTAWFPTSSFPTTMNTQTFGMGDYIGGTATTNPTNGQLFFTYSQPVQTTDTACPVCNAFSPGWVYSTSVYGIRATP
ncbi:MAG TPA: hypothetical protein VGJ84_04000, partial [Polyangiaceae bacterium]